MTTFAYVPPQRRLQVGDRVRNRDKRMVGWQAVLAVDATYATLDGPRKRRVKLERIAKPSLYEVDLVGEEKAERARAR